MSTGHAHEHHHGHAHGGHSHGLVDRSITRSRAGVKVVAISLVILLVSAVAQAVLYASTDSIALLADLIHNAGDAFTALPLSIAFYLRSERAEQRAGIAVVLTILVSGLAALVFAILRIVTPLPPTHLGELAIAGVIGIAGNALAAWVRLRGGRRLSSPALIADGQHAQSDAFVSLGVILSSVVVAIGAPIADPIIGLLITCMIMWITWTSLGTIRAGHAAHPHEH